MKRLYGKVAIIVGSTEGIGFAAAERLAEEGAKVVICGRTEQKVMDTVETLKNANLEAFGVRCHVGNSKDRTRLLDETIKKYGRLDILVVSAATNPTINPLLETEESEWDHIFHVNLKAAFFLVKEAVPHIRKHGEGGSIIFVSSIIAYTPMQFSGAYSVSKTALLGLTKVASLELAKEGIRVNCLVPGGVETNFVRNLKHFRSEVLQLVPMGRFAIPENISGVIAFLVSNDANYITGEAIVASGGMVSRL